MNEPLDRSDEIEFGPFVSMKVRETVYLRIKELAEAEDRSITAIVRRAVRAYEKATKR